jgi:transcription antitermination factor NusG
MNEMNELNLENSIPGKSEWYAVCTRHQHEKAVSERLAGIGFDVFLPTYEVVRQWKDRVKRLSLPLFPSYVFLRFGLERRPEVVSTIGVRSIVTFAGRPAPIPEIQIDAIKRVIENHLQVEPHPFLSCGDWVRVTFGPLAGIEGIVIRRRGGFRLILSAELLGRSISVEVDALNVEPLPHRAAVQSPDSRPACPLVDRGLLETGRLAGERHLEEQLQ